MLALQIDSGCRLGEATGLAISDIHLDTPVPYVKIQPHPWRSLKTANSERDVPLVGMSLDLKQYCNYFLKADSCIVNTQGNN